MVEKTETGTYVFANMQDAKLYELEQKLKLANSALIDYEKRLKALTARMDTISRMIVDHLTETRQSPYLPTKRGPR